MKDNGCGRSKYKGKNLAKKDEIFCFEGKE
jgi:hypothetical protein